MRIKRFFMLCLCLTFMISAVPVHASSDFKLADGASSIIQPQFTYISVFMNDFNIENNGKATIASSVTARNVDKIKINAYLQRYANGQWTTVKSWTITESGTIAVLDESWYVASGYQYRMVSYAYVYLNNQLLESTTYTSGTKIY